MGSGPMGQLSRRSASRAGRSPAMGEQPGGELAPAIPKARASHAPLPTDAQLTEVRLRPLFIHNRFNSERSPSTRNVHKQARAAAPAEWQTLRAG